jgi:hypothetical protein
MRIVYEARTANWLPFTARNDADFTHGSHKGSFVSGEQSGRELVATGSRTGREVQIRPAVQMGPESFGDYIKNNSALPTERQAYKSKGQR